MWNSDAVVGSVDSVNQVVSVAAYKLPDDSMPEESSAVSLYDNSGSYSNGISAIFFSRNISSGINPLTKPQIIIGAYHPDSITLVYHEQYHTTDLITQDFLQSANVQAPPPLPGSAEIPTRNSSSSLLSLHQIHGIVMCVGWGLLTFGVIFARYTRWITSKDDGRGRALWFIVHQSVQCTAFIIVIGGVILGIYMTHTHFQHLYHATLGFAITTVLIMQVLSAIFRPPPTPKDSAKTTRRKLFELFHWWIGRTLLILAALQIYSGIQMLGYPLLVWPYGIVVACVIALIIIAETFACFFPEKSKVVPCCGNCVEFPTRFNVVTIKNIYGETHERVM